MNYTIYDMRSGAIDRVVSCPQLYIDAQLQGGEAYIKGDYDGELYYVVGTINPGPSSRPVMSINSIGGVIDGIPMDAGATISYASGNSQHYIVSDGSIDLTGSSRGKYKVRISAFPFIDARVEVVI
jgi:hypothetical protein